MFLLFLWFLNTVDPGLKIAGVTKDGGNPKVFAFSLVLEP